MPQSLASEYKVTEDFEHASVQLVAVRPAANGLDIAGNALQRPGAVSLDTDGLKSADPLHFALISFVSGRSAQSMPSSPAVDMGLSGQRLFLDIFSSATRPPSQAAWDVGMQVLSVHPLCASKLDLFNNAHYGQLLRISFSGMTWLLAQARRVEISARLHFERVLAPDPFPLVSILWEFPKLQPHNTHAYAAVCACLNALLLYYWPFFRLVVMSSWNSLPMPYLGDNLWGSTAC